MNVSAAAMAGVFFALLGAPLAAQDPKAPESKPQAPSLERAIRIEEQEHDLERASKLYREVVDGAREGSEGHTRAAWRLGRALRLLGRAEEAKRWLEVAAKSQGEHGERARKMLQAPGLADQAKLRARVDQLVAAGAWQQLPWLGQAAVPRLLELWGTGRNTRIPWHVLNIGGERAKSFLLNASKAEKLAFLRGYVPGQHTHSSMLPALRSIVLDEELDPGLRADLVEKSNGILGLETYVLATRSHDARVACRAYVQVTNRWGTLGLTDRERIEECLYAQLEKDLAHELLERRSAARDCLGRCAHRTRRGRRLLLRVLPEWPREVHLQRLNINAVLESIDRSELDDVQVCAAKLGSVERERPDIRKVWVSDLAGLSASKCDARDLEQVLRLSKSGYLQADLSSWISERFPDAGRELIAKLDGSPQLVYVAARGVFDDVEPAPSDLAVLHRAWENAALGQQCAGLLNLIARCRTDASTKFVLRAGMTNPARLGWSLEALTVERSRLSLTRVHALLALDLLRAYPPLPAPASAERAHVRRRAAGFAACADADATWEALEASDAADREDLLEAALTQITRFGPQGSMARIWRKIAEKPKPHHWAALYAAFFFREGRQWEVDKVGSVFGPRRLRGNMSTSTMIAIMPKLLSAMESWVRAAKPRPQTSWRASAAFCCVRDMLVSRELFETAGAACRAPIRRVERALLESQHPALRLVGLNVLAKADRAPESELRPLVFEAIFEDRLSGSAARVATEHFHPTPAEMGGLVAKHKEHDSVLHRMLSDWRVRHAQTVLPLLESDVDINTQVVACSYLESCVDPVAVPKLLAATTHSAALVRKAAREALRAIRFHHETRAYWKKD